jgi:hypothetical protein
MSEKTRMSLKKWLMGAAASLFLSLLVACAAMVAGADWWVFLSVFGTAAGTHFSAWMKQHPIEEIDDTK